MGEVERERGGAASEVETGCHACERWEGREGQRGKVRCEVRGSCLSSSPLRKAELEGGGEVAGGERREPQQAARQ